MKNIENYKKKLEREMKSGLISLLILSTIKNSSEPVYGYQIIQDLRKSTKNYLILKEGSVYPILHYLKSQKFVVSFLDESPSGAPRKYYTITKLGEQAFKEGLESWSILRRTLESVFSEEEVS